MINVNIQAVPNQKFSAVLDGDTYDIELKSVPFGTTSSISRNNEPLTSNLICTANTPLLPYRYMTKGNFIFLTLDDAIPDYREFGITQNLIFASQAELEALANVP